MKNSLGLSLLSLVCFFSFVLAQPSKQLHFNFLGVKEGLPEGTVKSLLQDKYGYMWIGTQNGLVRFDGHKTKLYQLKTADGILSNILNLFEDKKGRLWVGSYSEGLFYYDRARDVFINYKIEVEKKSLIAPVKVITDDAIGNIWLIARDLKNNLDRVYCFNPQTKNLRKYGLSERENHYVNANTFFSFLIDHAGGLWLTSNNGFYNYNVTSDKFEGHFDTHDSSSQRGVGRLVEDAANPGILWADVWKVNPVTNEGLWCFNIKTNTLKKYIHEIKNPKSLLNDEILTIENFSPGYLWLGTDSGLSVFNIATNSFENYKPADGRIKSIDNFISSIRRDQQGNLWCQSAYGILFFDSISKQFTRYKTTGKNTAGLMSNEINNMLIGKDGTLWFGVEQLGLQWLNTERSRFTLYNNNPGSLHHFTGGTVNEFAETMDGTRWISSINGIYKWQPALDSFTQIFPKKRQGESVYANSLVVDKEGLIWFRAYGNGGSVEGLYAYNPQTGNLKNYRHKEHDSTSLIDDNIRSLYVDHNDILWIGTFGSGISSFDKKSQKFKAYPFVQSTGSNNADSPPNGSLDDDQVQTIYEDSKGTLWVGTNNGNINKLNRENNTFSSYNKSIPGFSTVMSIYADSKNNLWAGTYMNGLFKFTPGANNYVRTTEENGLLYSGIWGINEDSKGNIWIASPRGISILNPETKKIQNISSANGLPQEPASFNLYKTYNGQFLIGCKDGFIAVNPADFETAKISEPVIHIEHISITKDSGNKLIDSTIVTFETNSLHLRYDENRITFHYAGLQYQSPQLVQYAYQLEGYDNDWIDSATQQEVTYTNLSPGTYTFHIKAANSNGIWSKEDSLSITIAPPWWQRWWAWILYAIVTIAAISAIVIYRSIKLKKENKLLEEKVFIRTKELNESLAELKSAQGQLIQTEKLASLGELTAGIAHEIQNPLNFVNNFSELNGELINEMKEELTMGNLDGVRLIADDIAINEQKINQHGKRAEAIIKGMLQHSVKSTGQKELVNINALMTEYVRLSYHGFKAKQPSFEAVIKTDFETSENNIKIVPQDMGRVFLNILNNAFYAVNEKRKAAPEDYVPTVTITTKRFASTIQVNIKDNGNGIPENIAKKVFQPFFTTKPTGQGTGLGLSLAYDIITKEHSGKITLHAKAEEGAEFIITVPLSSL